MYKLATFVMALALAVNVAAAEDLITLTDSLIKKQMDKETKEYAQSKQPPKDGEDQMVYPEAAYKACIAYLQALQKSRDTELKRLYLLSEYVRDLEWEKSTIDLLDEKDKKEAQKKISELEATIAKLSKS